MYRVVPARDAPGLADEAAVRFREEWPEFIFHDAASDPYLEQRTEYFGAWEFFLVDENRRLIGGCWGVPISWDGSVADLPGGYTDTLTRAVEGYENAAEPDTFVLLAAAVRRDERGRGHASRLITAVRDRATAAGLMKVIAPVRPTLKSRYPLIPIEEFATWQRDDGLPMDPWMRTHRRLGATVLSCAPRSQTITGAVSEWELWTGLPMPSSGSYVIPDGLSVLEVDRDADRGVYHEPNVWMRHTQVDRYRSPST